MSVETREHIRKSNAIECWHFLKGDRRLNFEPRTPVKPGLKLTVKPPLRLCEHGLHASERPIDALQYAPGPVICRVRIWGEVIRGDDKLCGQHREVLWMADASSTLHRFACDVATGALDLIDSRGKMVDPRSRKAIEVKLAWLRGEATDEELGDACAAANAVNMTSAWAAAWLDPAGAARVSSWESAWEVAFADSSGAAHGVWLDVNGAARVSARDKQNRQLDDLLMQLKPTINE